MASNPKKSLGSCIDEMLKALEDIDDASQVIAIRAVCEHLNISIGIPRSVAGQEPLSDESRVSTNQKIVDLRTLKEQKNPRSSIEMACIVAYYLEHHAPNEERKTEITAKDITKYFAQAKYPLPKVRTQVLIDAKGYGYMDSKKRGYYQLNPVGYNLVVHSLPQRQKKR